VAAAVVEQAEPGVALAAAQRVEAQQVAQELVLVLAVQAGLEEPALAAAAVSPRAAEPAALGRVLVVAERWALAAVKGRPARQVQHRIAAQARRARRPTEIQPTMAGRMARLNPIPGGNSRT
jgi:hypothetical protein